MIDHVYTASALRKWDTDAQVDERWMPARPITYWSWSRFKIAWYVLIGKYDALDWEGS